MVANGDLVVAEGVVGGDHHRALREVRDQGALKEVSGIDQEDAAGILFAQPRELAGEDGAPPDLSSVPLAEAGLVRLNQPCRSFVPTMVRWMKR